MSSLSINVLVLGRAGDSVGSNGSNSSILSGPVFKVDGVGGSKATDSSGSKPNGPIFKVDGVGGSKATGSSGSNSSIPSGTIDKVDGVGGSKASIPTEASGSKQTTQRLVNSL